MTPRPFAPVIVDTSTRLSASEARALYDAGVRTVGRYVCFGSPRPGDIDSDELQTLIAAGLTVFLIQHVRNPGWVGSATTGQQDALAAVSNAIRAGYQGEGLCLALDLEGCRSGDPEHAAAWCSVVAPHYRPLVYVGYASGMSTATLDSLAGDPYFWADFAPLSMRPTPSAGWTLHQQAQSTIAGVGVDVDLLLRDGPVGLGPDGDPSVTSTADPAA